MIHFLTSPLHAFTSPSLIQVTFVRHRLANAHTRPHESSRQRDDYESEGNESAARCYFCRSTRSKYEVAELLCQLKVGDYICYTSREQLLTRLLLTGPDGTPLATKKKLMKLLDLNKTSADVFTGCTLIKLNRERYDKLRTRLSVRRPYAKHTARFSGGKKSDRAQSIMTAAEKIHLVTSIVESEIVNYLIDIPFLENVEDSRLVTLSNLCSYMFVKGGDVLCSEGEVGDRFFICIRGSLQATVNVHLNAASQTYMTLSSDQSDQAGRHRLLGSSLSGFERKIQALKRMSTGSYFGEISLLFKIPRIASITALEDSLLVYIDRTTFCNFLKMAPEASLVLLEHVRMHFLDNLIKQGCAFLNAIPPIKLQELSAMSELIEHHTGSTILRKGDRKTAFYILLRGEVEMVYEDDDEGNRPESTNNNYTAEEGTVTEVAAYKEKKQPDNEEEPRVASSNRAFRRNSATVFSVANSLVSSTMTSGRRGMSTFVVDRPDSVAIGATNRRKTHVEHGPRKMSSSFVF
ncbi:Dicarboxylate/amino acid:cation symporter, partial [Globisporangium splendens]